MDNLNPIFVRQNRLEKLPRRRSFGLMSGLISEKIESLLATAELPDLGPGPRPDVKPIAELNRTLDELFRDAKISQGRQQLIRHLILLWHDHLELANAMAQDIPRPDGV